MRPERWPILISCARATRLRIRAVGGRPRRSAGWDISPSCVAHFGDARPDPLRHNRANERGFMSFSGQGRAVALALIIGAGTGGSALAAPGDPPPPASTPVPWTERIEAGIEYRGDFTAEDRTLVGARQVAVRCAMLPSTSGEGFDISLRQTPDNKISNLINLSLILEIGVGNCADFKLIRVSPYDPAAPLALGDNGRVRFFSGGGDYAVRSHDPGAGAGEGFLRAARPEAGPDRARPDVPAGLRGRGGDPDRSGQGPG
ncbi:hypothetical protein LRS04_16655 [Phenylobacterium sp. J367]|nr:hypothetical protein [Phenylobacterium sp. J367]